MKSAISAFLSELGITSPAPAAYFGHEWLSMSKHLPFVTRNPADGQVIAEVYTATEDDYTQLLSQAEAAQKIWALVPAPERGQVVRAIADALRLHKASLGDLIAFEMGKSRAEAQGEVQEMIDMADFAVGQSRMLYGKTMHSERPQHRLYEQWHPYGIIGVITAFNFPMAVWAWNAFLSAICGNITIWKPSSQVPLCAIAVHRVCAQVLKKLDCPPIFGLCIGHDASLKARFLEDKRIPVISFTGSTAIGRVVASTVAARLGKTILELGGNNAIIVDETADIALALRALLFSAIGTAGQRCTSARRVFIHQSLFKDFVRRLKTAYQQIVVGDPFSDAHMGPLISAAAVQQFKTATARIRTLGGKIIFGGDILPGTGYYVQPTLVSNVQPDWDIVQEETFAPIVYLIPVSDIQQAVQWQNAVSQGLSSALFSNNLRHTEYFVSSQGSDCGIANINVGTSGAEIGGAFGGEKDTGGGREAGSDAWKFYMRRQTNTINWGSALPLAQGIHFDMGDPTR
ncbi:MAG: aldehyde dehydrogenase family protein [Legionellaceae bacterium]|nr:aldehyde dehydrogenase family protein [Legionellaceae bacterium]